MGSLEWYDYLRIVTIALLLVTMWKSGRRFSCGELKTGRDRDYFWAFNVLLFLVAEISLELILIDADLGPRTILSFLAACICLRAEARGRPDFLTKD